MSETAAQPEQEPVGVPPGEFSDDLAGDHPQISLQISTLALGIESIANPPPSERRCPCNKSVAPERHK